MNRLIVIFFGISFSLNTIPHVAIGQDTLCNFLNNIKYKNGVDTVVIKASYLGVTKISGNINGTDFVNKLIKLHKGVIIRNTFQSQIEFHSENCSEIYDGPLKYLDHNTLSLISGMTVYLTCIAFEGYKYDNYATPYFIVINVRRQKPSGFK